MASAIELYQRAYDLDYRQGDWQYAEDLYKKIIEQHPYSDEKDYAHVHRQFHIDPEMLNNHAQEKQTILNSYESKLISNSTKNNMIKNKNPPLKMIQSDLCDDDKLLEDKSNQ